MCDNHTFHLQMWIKKRARTDMQANIAVITSSSMIVLCLDKPD